MKAEIVFFRVDEEYEAHKFHRQILDTDSDYMEIYVGKIKLQLIPVESGVEVNIVDKGGEVVIAQGTEGQRFLIKIQG